MLINLLSLSNSLWFARSAFHHLLLHISKSFFIQKLGDPSNPQTRVPVSVVPPPKRPNPPNPPNPPSPLNICMSLLSLCFDQSNYSNVYLLN